MRLRQAATGFVLAAATAAVLAAPPALAETRHRSTSAVAGEQIPIGRHVHFKAATCEALSIPKIVPRGKPAMGTLAITKAVAPLRKARSERGKRCIGTPVAGAAVQYTPLANAEGVETIVYDVIFPKSCTKCRNFQMQVAVTIHRPAESQMAGPREASVNPERPTVADDSDEM